MLRDQMLCSMPESSCSNSGSFDAGSSALEMEPTLQLPDHEYQYLDQIHSEDLMKFCEPSQSSLSQLIEPVTSNIQAIHHEVLPDLEEHDKGGMSFELCLEPQKKTSWFYSSKFNKVYIKIDEIISIDVLYKPRTLNDKYYVRVMLVYNAEVSEPVVRCENHSAKDKAIEKNIKHSVLRCENPNVIYLGEVEGKNISDRLSARIPLGCVQPNEESLVKQTIALKFVCQNSCVGRRETSIIFFMENAYGEILAKRVTAVKICSCPKRDMKKDEGSELPKKRSQIDECPIGKKIMRVESEIKVEVEQPDEKEDDTLAAVVETNNITVTEKGVQLVLMLPNVAAAAHVAECAFNKVAGQMAMNPDDNAVLYSHMRVLKKTHVSLQQLNKQRNRNSSSKI